MNKISAKKQAEMQESYEYSVYLANTFMRHFSDLTLTEIKIIRYLIMKVNNVDDEFQEVRININLFAKLIGVKPQNLYAKAKKEEINNDDVKDICVQLSKKQLLIEDPKNPDKWLVFNWLSYAGRDKGVMIFRLNDKLKGYLLYLKKHFTAYKYEEISPLKSVYSVRIYEMIFWALSENKAKKPKDNEQKQVYISMDDLKKYLGLEKKYEKASHFKLRILNPSMEDINERSPNYHISCKDEKTGRSIVGFNFIIETKEAYERRVEIEGKDGQLRMDLSDKNFIRITSD